MPSDSDSDSDVKYTVLALAVRRRGTKRKREIWVKDIFRKREEQGDFHNLIPEMRLNDHEGYRNFFRMGPDKFDELLSMVGPFLTKEMTYFRRPISAAERLAVTLS